MPTICVDVMGSDQGPSVVLEGVERALAKDAELVVLLAGSDEEVTPFAEKHDRVRTVVSSEVIGMDEHPANAVRQKKDASIVRAAAAVKQGEAEGLFSAGSTGAVLTAATFGIGRIKGIKRPALALILPGLDGHRTVFLDTGANADVKPELMVDFARMGIAYAQVALGIQEPSVGLLTNGAEDTKGSELTLAYHDILAHAKVNFSGNAEGVDLLGSRFDVIVADGMTGNVALKSIESTGRFILSRIKDSVATSKKAALGAFRRYRWRSGAFGAFGACHKGTRISRRRCGLCGNFGGSHGSSWQSCGKDCRSNSGWIVLMSHEVQHG